MARAHTQPAPAKRALQRQNQAEPGWLPGSCLARCNGDRLTSTPSRLLRLHAALLDGQRLHPGACLCTHTVPAAPRLLPTASLAGAGGLDADVRSVIHSLARSARRPRADARRQAHEDPDSRPCLATLQIRAADLIRSARRVELRHCPLTLSALRSRSHSADCADQLSFTLASQTIQRSGAELRARGSWSRGCWCPCARARERGKRIKGVVYDTHALRDM
jgi:hypothetical protein